jgi:uncharacterized protein (TIGR02118 family)
MLNPLAKGTMMTGLKHRRSGSKRSRVLAAFLTSDEDRPFQALASEPLERRLPVWRLPMFKMIALVSKKPGLSRDEFIDYYETKHVPLVRKLFPKIQEYRRNFLDLDGAIITTGTSAPDFDVVTEFWFADRAAYEETLATYGDSSLGEAIRQDEENFLDRSKMRFIVVDEYGSSSKS